MKAPEVVEAFILPIIRVASTSGVGMRVKLRKWGVHGQRGRSLRSSTRSSVGSSPEFDPGVQNVVLVFLRC